MALRVVRGFLECYFSAIKQVVDERMVFGLVDNTIALPYLIDTRVAHVGQQHALIGRGHECECRGH